MSGFRFGSLSNLIPLGNNSLRAGGVYLSGVLFAGALWIMIDAGLMSKSIKNGSDVHMKIFPDWVPLICSFLGMSVVNIVDKSALLGDSSSYNGVFSGSNNITWRARLVLFIGFALLAGGVAGSIATLVLKYIVNNDYSNLVLYFGWAGVISNFLLLLSCSILWIAQNVQDEYTYSLAL